MQEGKIKPEDLNIELIKQTYKDLSSGAKEGFGKSWETQYTKKGDETVVTELKKKPLHVCRCQILCYARNGKQDVVHSRRKNATI